MDALLSRTMRPSLNWDSLPARAWRTTVPGWQALRVMFAYAEVSRSGADSGYVPGSRHMMVGVDRP
jgi:hypothetical protein